MNVFSLMPYLVKEKKATFKPPTIEEKDPEIVLKLSDQTENLKFNVFLDQLNRIRSKQLLSINLLNHNFAILVEIFKFCGFPTSLE